MAKYETFQPLDAYEGADNRLYTDPWAAAADIIKSADRGHFRYLTDDPPANQRLKDAILWTADAIRENDAKLKRERRRKRQPVLAKAKIER